MTGLYVYGIMRHTDLAKLDQEALLLGQDALFVVEDGFAAVARPTREDKFEPTAEALLAHYELLLKLMKAGPVFPVRYGTVAETEEEVRELLRFLASAIDPIFERLKGKVEFDVEARWNPQVAYPQIAEADPQIKALKARIASQGTEPSLADRLMVGKRVAEQVARQAEQFGRRIEEALRGIALDCSPLPRGKDQDLFLNMGFFVEEAKTGAFERSLYELGECFHDAVHFKYAGPLPPYTFTGYEITVATAGMLEEARRLLELGETFTAEEFLHRYRRLSLAWHPDRNLGDPLVAEHFKRVVAACAASETILRPTYPRLREESSA